MSQSFLARRSVFGLSGALVILLIFFFLLPSAFRGARLAIAGKKNNIKDWLPSDFQETVELDWFAKYFMGESFVIATWDGCTSQDQRLDLFAAKLRQESTRRSLPLTAEHRRARALGEELQLFIEPPEMDNWGGLNEKWFSSPSGRYYFLTPDGHLHRWEEGNNVVGGISRVARRALGKYTPRGRFVAAFGQPSTRESVNEFYNNPVLLAASLFQTVETGVDMVKKLAVEGGPLWPVDLTDADQRASVARTRAMERLTGTLFAPAVPPEFDWSPLAVFEQLPESSQAMLPDDFDVVIERTVEQISQRFGGTLEGLKDATIDEQGTAWDEVCKALGVPTPPRQTCIIVTLTQLGKDYLGRAVGRGVVGGPRGRLLILADQSGLGAAPPPSMAPPPFDKDERELAAASGRTILRLGGPPIDNISIDEEGTVTLVRLVGYSGLVGLALSFLCFRSFNLTLMIFTCGLSAAVLSLAICYWAGGNVDAILMTMPSLVYVLGLSGAIHIVNYYRDEVRSGGTEGAASRAIRHAFMPCMLAAVTTSLGLISLCTSNIVPIFNFGLYSAIAVIATLLILFTYLPAALETFTPKFAVQQAEIDRKRIAAGLPPGGGGDDSGDGGSHLIAEIWASIGRFVTCHYRIITFVCLSVFVIGLAGIPKIKTSVQLLKLFDSESRIIADYAYLEENFGKLVPMELVLRVPSSMITGPGAEAIAEEVRGGSDSAAKRAAQLERVRNRIQAGEAVDGPPANAVVTNFSHPLTLLQRAEAVGRVDTAVRRTLGEAGTGVVGRTMSAVTFLPPLPEPSNTYTPIRARFENQLTASLGDLGRSDFYRVEKTGPFAGSELWRISLRVGALSDVDYGQFVGDLRKTVTPVLDAYRARELILDAANFASGDGVVGAPRREPPRILVLGHREPKRMTNEDFLAVGAGDDRDAKLQAAVADGRQSDLILQERLFVSSLSELLSGERIKRPLWVDLDSAQTKVSPGTPQWQTLLDAVDVIVLVGDQKAIDVETLAKSGKRFVDVRQSNLPEAEPILISMIPTEKNAGPLQAIYTGVVPVVYKAQRTLLVSLIESIVLAFFLIAFVMIALLLPGRLPGALLQPRLVGCGVVAGMVAMIPNLFPVVLIFGMMGHSNTLVDIGTMMTASVAMGVAVDDTIHFLTWFREHIDRGMSRVDAVIETYRRVGPAMTQTTIVGGLGLFVFALSTFTPTQRFGTLMLVLLAAALVGDLILLPSLLAGPMGKWFRPRPPAGGVRPSDTPTPPGATAGAVAETVEMSRMTDEMTGVGASHAGERTMARKSAVSNQAPEPPERQADLRADHRPEQPGPSEPKGNRHRGSRLGR